MSIDGNSALIWAAMNGYTGVVNALLAVQGIDVNAKDKAGYSVLIAAAKNG